MYRKFIKRFLDIFFSVAMFIALLPVMLVVCLIVFFEDGLPVLFRQQRITKGDREFTIHKIRTMRLQKYQNEYNDSARMLKSGSWIRKLSLDELPQLWDILKGDMSFIGPRPLPPHYIPYYSKEERLRHSVLAGVTGLAQVKGRSTIDWEQKFEYDVQYTKNISFINDLKIVLMTIKKLFMVSEVLDYGIGSNIDFAEYKKNKLANNKELPNMDNKNNFVKKLTVEPNIFHDQIKELQATSLPVVLYGAGCLADEIFKTLTIHGIKTDDVFVDSPSEQQTFHGIKALDLSQICKKHKKFNALLAFQDFEGAEKRLSSVSNVNKIYKIIELSLTSSITREFCNQNADRLEIIYNRLGDELSRQSLVAYINALLSGNSEYLYPVYNPDTYFPIDLFQLSDNESIVDCGAFIGDTLADAIKRAPSQLKGYFAFEPDPVNFKRLSMFVEDMGLKSPVLVQKGASDDYGRMEFAVGEGENSRAAEGSGNFIELCSIDSVVGDNAVTLIKMDIEGSELAALHGAANTITKCKPKLAICIYHKPEDLFEIPEYILSLVPDYKLYIRQHCKVPANLVLYAL